MNWVQIFFGNLFAWVEKNWPTDRNIAEKSESIGSGESLGPQREAIERNKWTKLYPITVWLEGRTRDTRDGIIAWNRLATSTSLSLSLSHSFSLTTLSILLTLDRRAVYSVPYSLRMYRWQFRADKASITLSTCSEQNQNLAHFLKFA